MYIFTVILAKIIRRFIDAFKLGAGHTWPGHLALKMYPSILKEISLRLPKSVVFISGTNGKTTTAKILRHIMQKNGQRVLYNATGANLLNGIVSSVLLSSDSKGKLGFDIAILELDEFTLPKLMEKIKPSVLALLNLSRDQLDRHWETDLVFAKWLGAVEKLSEETKLIMDKDQSLFTILQKSFKGKTYYFDDSLESTKGTPLKGSFNAKNTNCALLVAEALGMNVQTAQENLKDFEYAYGRGEEISYKNKSWQILLAKNPESLNQNLKLLSEDNSSYEALLYVLNDNIPDGLDVSWIYDVSARLLRGASENKKIYVSGVRALDMAVRLQYAGMRIYQENVHANLKQMINKISFGKEINRIVLLPNYSAMLEARKIITGRKIL